MFAPERVSAALLLPSSAKLPPPAITPANVPGVIWLIVNVSPVWVLIVAVFVPLLGAAIVPLSDPVVSDEVVERFKTTAVPAPVFRLLTWRGPVPNVPAPLKANAPPMTIVPPL